ncbi:unnamed protein product [Macrosiphum euphorbiae]|uniref:Uncharacterized protein n=1 Tax=Macrosiphum euphorbiae TaxID=13131 RepID=A0AAV0WAK8_9HEMI|nr:unnamed protein product [Macrosiphum euphorbiae]
MIHTFKPSTFKANQPKPETPKTYKDQPTTSSTVSLLHGIKNRHNDRRLLNDIGAPRRSRLVTRVDDCSIAALAVTNRVDDRRSHTITPLHGVQDS